MSYVGYLLITALREGREHAAIGTICPTTYPVHSRTPKDAIFQYSKHFEAPTFFLCNDEGHATSRIFFLLFDPWTLMDWPIFPPHQISLSANRTQGPLCYVLFWIMLSEHDRLATVRIDQLEIALPPKSLSSFPAEAIKNSLHLRIFHGIR